MIAEKKFLENLKDFGLNQYESKIWVALLSRGISTAGELSDIANVPRSRSYDVLESLEKKGFVIMKLGKPIKYIAVPPHEVVERVKKKIREDMNEKTNMIDEIKGSDMITELNLLYSQGVEMVEVTDLTAALKGRDNIYDHFQLMLSTATESVKLMTTEEGIINKAKTLKTAFEKLKANSIKISIIVPITEKNAKVVEELREYAEIKNAKKEVSRFLIVDDTEVMFMLLPDTEVHPSYDVGVWVNTPFFAQSLGNMFDVIFELEEPQKH